MRSSIDYANDAYEAIKLRFGSNIIAAYKNRDYARSFIHFDNATDYDVKLSNEVENVLRDNVDDLNSIVNSM